MERCPNCRARYRGGSSECYRCGMDLSRLLRLETWARQWEKIAIERLVVGDRAGAKVAAEQTLALQRRPLALALREFIRQSTVRNDPIGWSKSDRIKPNQSTDD